MNNITIRQVELGVMKTNRIIILVILAFTLLSPKLYSQNDTLIRYLSGSVWLWNEGDSISSYAHLSPNSDTIIGNTTIHLTKVSSSDYSRIADFCLLSFMASDNPSYVEELHKYDDKKDYYTTLSKLPWYQFGDSMRNGFYSLEVMTGGLDAPDQVASTRVGVSRIADLQFTLNKNDNTLNMDYEYYIANSDESKKKQFRYRVAIVNSNQIELEPFK